MRWVMAEGGQLRMAGALGELCASGGKSFVSGLAALDELLPGGAWARGAVHEFLGEGGMSPAFAALVVARAAIWRGVVGRATRPTMDGRVGRPTVCQQDLTTPHAPSPGFRGSRPRKPALSRGERGEEVRPAAALVWCDRSRRFYPPAAAALGVPVERLFLLRAGTEEDELWAIGQCLRCPGVGATVASLGRLTQLQARRLQLAAEEGGGIGVLLRPAGRESRIYAAATRWLVSRAPGDSVVQRWRLQLVHGHGGRVGASVYLEHSRDIAIESNLETNPVRAVAELADRPDAASQAEKRRMRVA